MKKLAVLIALVTALAFASAAMAQAPAKPATTPAPAAAKPATTAPAPAAPKEVKIEKFSGAIEKIDEMAKAIVVKGKKETKTFATDDKTKIAKGKAEIPFADLKKGMAVSVEYKKDGDKMIAVSIKTAAPKAPAEKKGEEKKQ